MVPAVDGPTGATGSLFAPLRETTPVRFERITSGGQDRWVEHDPSGRKRFYGRNASGSKFARITNELGTTSWLLVVYLGVVTMALAYVLLYAGLRSTPSRTAVVATLLEPVTAVAIAVLVLGERLSLAGAVGALLIVAAIASLGLQPTEPAPQ